MNKHSIKKGFSVIALFFCIAFSRAQSGNTRIAAMQHIKIVKTPVKGEDQVSAQLTAMDADIKTINTEIQKVQADLTSLKSIQQNLQAQLNSMSEISEMTSMRIQMAMDSRSRFIETLSNMLKKMSDTQNEIVQNMK